MDELENKIVTTARELLKLYGYYVDNLWHVHDVHFICEQNNIAQINDKEALEVFEIASEQFDGETGISWPKLEKALYTFLQRKTVLDMLCHEDKVS
jgi:hypothetical protein